MGNGRGFALAELLVAMVIAGIIGVALTRLVINQARFVSTQDAMMRARSGARASVNVLVDEMRMVSGSGAVVQANADSITLRVPYAWGVACARIFGFTIASMLPTDSATFAAATPSGYAWRRSNGNYVFEDGAAYFGSVPTTPCGWAGVSVLSAPGWSARAIAVTQDLLTDTAAAIYLYQRIRYSLAASVELPGQLALWRHVISTGVREEMVAPFDTASGFSFLVGTRYTAQAAPPAPLDSLRGVRMRLVALSETPPQGRTQRTKFDVSVDIYFRNYAP